MVWVVAVIAGTAGMVRYQMTAAATLPTVPRQWPGLASVIPDGERPTLVLTLHPHCPCSRATVHELAELMARADGRVAAHVLFVRPIGAPSDWLDGDLWKAARAIPGVDVVVDRDGRDALALAAIASGHAFVYDPKGRLLFNGGITDGRGHEGDNPGYLAILALLREGKSPLASTPVHGCSLGVCSMDKKSGNGL
jgi:hypothetical protein